MSERAKHTPGPWSLVETDTRDGERVCVVGAPPRRTRLVTFGPRKNWDGIDEANANLVAAAPDLLAACEEFEAYYATGRLEQFGELRERIRAAIAKAKG